MPELPVSRSRVGLIVNPIAGIGGPLGLKGTDGVVASAHEHTSLAQSSARATLTLSAIARGARSDIELLVPSGLMGQVAADRAGLESKIVYAPAASDTSATDTKAAARAIRQSGAALLLFAGGDGTARDIADVIGDSLPVVGIPTGVKMHSSVFARNPLAASDVITQFLRDPGMPCERLEVFDVDEELFRRGRLRDRLCGFLIVPQSRLLQGPKQTSLVSDDFAGLSNEIRSRIANDCAYVLGPGSTMMHVAEAMGIAKTPFGVDVLFEGKLTIRDADEAALLSVKHKRSMIILSPVGGQGFILGRGNQQISARVVRDVGIDNITIVATERKLAELPERSLFVDSGDSELDRLLSRPTRVVTGYRREMVISVKS